MNLFFLSASPALPAGNPGLVHVNFPPFLLFCFRSPLDVASTTIFFFGFCRIAAVSPFTSSGCFVLSWSPIFFFSGSLFYSFFDLPYCFDLVSCFVTLFCRRRQNSCCLNTPSFFPLSIDFFFLYFCFLIRYVSLPRPFFPWFYFHSPFLVRQATRRRRTLEAKLLLFTRNLFPIFRLPIPRPLAEFPSVFKPLLVPDLLQSLRWAGAAIAPHPARKWGFREKACDPLPSARCLSF